MSIYANDHIYIPDNFSRDPAIAKRVRILHLYPHFVKDAIETTHTSSSQSLFSKFGELAGQLKFCKQKSRLPIKFKNCTDLMQVMSDILSHLPNLTDYHVLWSGLPSVGSYPALVLSSPLQLNLRCLHLEISLEKLEYMLSHPLPEIEELDLFIRVEPDRLLDPDDYDTILVMLAHMISSVHSSLRKLTIQLWEPFNLSPLFFTMSHLPLLDKLSLSIPMSSPNLGNPSGLIDFLNCHSSTLRSLSIRASELGGRNFNKIQLGRWMDKTFSRVHLSSLTSLEISLYLVPFDSALLCVRRFSATLTSLIFTGLHLTYEDLELLTAAFLPLLPCPRKHPYTHCALKYARIGPLMLSPQVIDLFAERFSNIEKLELIVKSIVPSEGDVPFFNGNECTSFDKEQDEGQVQQFIEEMKYRRYPEWNLGHLDMMSSSYPRLNASETQYRSVFKQCVPALRTFI